MTGEDYIILGTISKTHGVRGELIIRIMNPAFEQDENWESLFLQIDGILVPFFISSLHDFRPGEWIVSFDDYKNKTSAETLVGYSVWIHKDSIEIAEDEVYMVELIGYGLLNISTGKHGVIADFMDIPGNPVFEVRFEGAKILVPAQDDLIEEIDANNQKITMRLPDGIM